MPNRRQEIASCPDSGPDEEGFGAISEVMREHRRDWRHHQDRRGIVEKRRHSHRRYEDQGDRAPWRQGGRQRASEVASTSDAPVVRRVSLTGMSAPSMMRIGHSTPS